MKWRLYRRKGRAERRRALRGVEYDGSRWSLFKSYDDERDARAGLSLHETRADNPWGRVWQFKLVPPHASAP